MWAVLSDLPAYVGWNPFIVDAAGVVAVGRRLRLRLRLGERETTVRPVVTARREAALLSWKGRLGLPGLFDAAHHHELVATGAGTRYVHRELLSGLLVPFVGRTLDAAELAFHAMNEALVAEVVRRRRRDERAHVR